MGATVSQTRAWLEAAHDLPENFTTHFLIVAHGDDAGTALITCCDRTDHAASLARMALAGLDAPVPPVRSSPTVIVSRDDLTRLLATVTGHDPALTSVTWRLRRAVSE